MIVIGQSVVYVLSLDCSRVMEFDSWVGTTHEMGRDYIDHKCAAGLLCSRLDWSFRMWMPHETKCALCAVSLCVFRLIGYDVNAIFFNTNNSVIIHDA